MQNNTYTSVVD